MQGVHGGYRGHLGWRPHYAKVVGRHRFAGLCTVAGGAGLKFSVGAAFEHPRARARDDRGSRAPAGRRGHPRGTRSRRRHSPSFQCRGCDSARPHHGAFRDADRPLHRAGLASLVKKDSEKFKPDLRTVSDFCGHRRAYHPPVGIFVLLPGPEMAPRLSA